ncbi:DUF262 domain-containing protein [Bartonella sp. HY761]|uniref:DUF262 domain-containing protein n=1 Tax=Bartonella sp. HY761 TaxID=2979330 RepID=UPI0021E204B2|nr:DUF262 domain-containing HNH endonuclease family protein [Bartonella sp. HY761]UXN07948.1 DUF262 domain-containing HNH endonuclease family protein [Bartonella sp. HY761]
MKPYTRSIIELFDGKKRFLIPLYQRKYAWQAKPQLELLWEDILRSVRQLMQDRSNMIPHFMGAIVISQIKTFGKEVQSFEIIDGQQRLTTFQLLLAALRDVANINSSHYATEINKYLVNDGIMQDPIKEKFKLWPSLTDRRAFVSIIDPKIDEDAYGLPLTDEDERAKRSIAAYSYLKDKIQSYVSEDGEFNEDRIEILFEALKAGLAIVSIELEGGDDPQTIFETLNSRGVDLSPSDLMRNFIFQRAKGLGQENHSLVIDKLYEKYWLPLDFTFWSEPASRGRQKHNRLDWMMTDHLAMHTGDIVSIENLFERYRYWILESQHFSSVTEELKSIAATSEIEKRLFDQDSDDVLGNFGIFADAFDVSTAMPLVIYLATELKDNQDLIRALKALESFILRRDLCRLPTKAYNRFFIGVIDRLRKFDGNKVDTLLEYLSSRTSENDRWPNNREWQRSWLEKGQYKGLRQARLRFIFQAIELELQTKQNEKIAIKSTLSVEHIMPQKWEANWPFSEFSHLSDDEKAMDVDYAIKRKYRDDAINTMGNLTLLTHSLNSSVSNGSYSIKMPAIRAQSSLALNRSLNEYGDWNETSITERGKKLFNIAKAIWMEPLEVEKPITKTYEQGMPLPPEGTECKFAYSGSTYQGVIRDGELVVAGFLGSFKSFSTASKAVTNTSRNGWFDWYLKDANDNWIIADDWRSRPNN